MKKKKQKKGFALWDKEKLREVAAKGGRNAAPESRRFYVDREAAAECGSRGHEGKGKKKDDNSAKQSSPAKNARPIRERT